MKLTKELGLLDIFCICTGAMFSGLFLLPGLAYLKAGPSILGAYILGGLLAGTGLLSQAELVSAMPKAGGTYIYVTRSLGSGIGTVYGLITWLCLILKSAYELVLMAVILFLFFNLNTQYAPCIAAGICLIFILINLVGIKEAGKLQVVIVFCILGALLYYIGKGMGSVDVHHFDPFLSQGSGAMLATAGYVFISFGGLLKVASIAEEVKDAGRVVPLGMILSLVFTLLIYLLVIFVTIGVLDGELADSKNPIAEGAMVFLGQKGKSVFSFVAILAIISAANAGIMSASRYPLALARDEMLPDRLATINKRYKTPHIAILLTGAIVMASLFIQLDILIKAASSVLILTYLFSCLAVVILREGRLQNYQPQFRSPLYPWVQIIGIIGFCLLLLELGQEALLSSAILIAGGLFLYWFFGRIKAAKEYALLHLIERITTKELTSHCLETELKEIVRERDEISKDRFDNIIEDCPVLDIKQVISKEECFKQVADKMASRIDMAPGPLEQLFLDREQESSTVLNPFLAIPHIIIEGNHKFDILLARGREGIHFSEEAPRVHTVFFLVGSTDERHFHLRALAAIAQLVQDPNFEKKWMAAKSPQALRDVILLSSRKRDK